MIAYCGLDCSKCEAYLATQTDDDDKRIMVAKEWSAMYHADIKPEQINWDGSRSGGSEAGQACRFGFILNNRRDSYF